jgi:hypothetical protein
MYLIINRLTLKEPSSPVKYVPNNDADDVFFLSLWLLVLGHEGDILEHLHTVQVSQHTFLLIQDIYATAISIMCLPFSMYFQILGC